MSINCLKGKFKTKAQALISEDVSESEAIAQVLNQEYTEIMSQLNEISPTQQATPQQDLITLPQQEAITFPEESQKEEYDGPVYNFASKTNRDGVLISDLLSEIITMYVDAANDPDKITDLNAGSDIAPVIIMMLRKGIPARTVFFFVNQPVIKTYLKNQSNNQSASNTFKRKSKHQIIRDVLNEYNVPSNMLYPESLIYNNPTREKAYDNFTLAELKKGLEGKADPLFHRRVLDVFLEEQRFSDENFQKMIRSTSADTQGFKNFMTLDSQLQAKEDVEAQEVFINYENMFKDFIGEFQKTKQEFAGNIKTYLISEIEEYRQVLDKIKDVIDTNYKSPEKRARLYRKMESEFFIFLAQKNGLLQQNKLYDKYYKGEHSIPKKVKKLQNIFKENGIKNAFLDSVVVELYAENEPNFDKLKPIEKKVREVESELITAGFKELTRPDYAEWYNEELDMPEGDDFADMLIKFLFSQSGTNYSPFNLVQFIPSEDYKGLISGVIDSLQDKGSKENIEDFIPLFILNNSEDFSYGTDNLDWILDKELGDNFVRERGTTQKIFEQGDVNFKDYRRIETRETFSDDAYQSKGNYKVPSTDLNNALTSYLKDLGVEVQLVDKIYDSEGNEVDAVAKANAVEKVIQLVEGQISQDTLPEEAVHIITAMIYDTPLMKRMMGEIVKYDVYNEVKADPLYKNLSEERQRFEAVGKLITKHVINKYPLSKKERTQVTGWWNKLLQLLKDFISGVNFAPVKKEIDMYEKLAADILNEVVSTGEAGIVGDFFQSRSRLVDIARMFNINTSGFMPSSINPDDLKIQLRRRGFEDVSVKESRNGSYYLVDERGKMIKFFGEDAFQSREQTQDFVVNSVLEVSATVADKKAIVDGKELYTDEPTGEVIPGRATMITAKLHFEKGKTKEQLEEQQKRPKTILGKKYGIEFHRIMDEFTNYLGTTKYNNIDVGDKTTNTPPVASYNTIQARHMKRLKNSADKLVGHISKRQESIDENGKARIFTELTIRGRVHGMDTAGTVDLLVVYSDGRVSIFDHKFMSPTYKQVGKTLVPNLDDPIPFYKVDSYETQIGIYKTMLQKMGITKFDDTRILPGIVEFNQNPKTKEIQDSIKELLPFNTQVRALMPLPVQEELTGNITLDEILSKLFEEKKRIIRLGKKYFKQKSISKKERINLQKQQLDTTIQDIQLTGNIGGLVQTLEAVVETERFILGDETNPPSRKDLLDMKYQLGVLLSLQDGVVESLPEDMKDDAYKAFREGNQALNRIEDKIKAELISEDADIYKPQRELTMWQSWTGFLSKISQPVFEVARKYVKKAYGDINRDVEKIIIQAEEQRNNLKTWANGRGITLINAYRKLINPKNGNLIYTFSDEFWKLKNEAVENKNIAWLKQQYEITEEGKKAYKEEFEEFKKSLQVQGIKGKTYTNELRKFQLKYDLNTNTAWLNSYTLNRYATVKNPGKWYSNEYKDLLKPENKGLKDYFDWYTKTNKDFNSLVPERIGKSFVANIHKDVIDRVAQGGSLMSRKQMKNLFSSLRTRQEDIIGAEEGNSIPLIYYDNFIYKDEKTGEWINDPQAKNEDLTYAMILFAESVYRKHHMSKIEDTMDLLKMHLSEQQVVKTTALGNPKYLDAAKKIPNLVDSAINYKTFESIINGTVYRQKLQNKDVSLNLFGQSYSLTKIIKHIMSFLSAKALGWNYVSAFGNLVGGHGNIFIKATGGRVFTVPQLKKAWSMMIFRNKDNNLFHHLAEYFNVEKENWISRDAARLSASAITRNLTYDKIYLLQQSGDEMVGNIVLMSMLQNYGLDSNGEIQLLNDLPEGSKSLLERVKREEDKIIIDGMDPETQQGRDAFDDFRNRVRYQSRQIKGTNTQEDISSMQTKVQGQVLLQFRSWVAPMVSERYGGIKYTKEIQDWEMGRYNSLMQTLFTTRFIPNIFRIATDIVTLGAWKYKGDKKLLQQQYNDFTDKNPDVDIDINDYIELRERTIRESIVEARMISAFVTLLMFAKADFDDDGVANYKENGTAYQAYRLMNRAYLELSFFSNPTSFNALIKDPIPILSVAESIGKFGINTFDEVFDTLAMPFGYEDKDDTKGPGYELGKLIIGVRFIQQIADDYDINEE